MKYKKEDLMYLLSIFYERDREKLLSALLKIRKRCCAYSGPLCDCKYGVTDESACGMHEKGNGCPELATACSLLFRLTDKEYAEILQRRPEYDNNC